MDVLTYRLDVQISYSFFASSIPAKSQIFLRYQLCLVSSHSNLFVIVIPSLSKLSTDLLSPLDSPASLSLLCTVVVVKHISSSSGLQFPESSQSRLTTTFGGSLTVPSPLTSTSSSSWVNCKLSNSSFLILRVRFFDIVSIVFKGKARELLLPEEEDFLLEGRKARQGPTSLTRSGRKVGRQPLIMPMEGSTEDQMKTSLLAQLISLVRTRCVMVMMR
jgi:hypothetical protein